MQYILHNCTFQNVLKLVDRAMRKEDTSAQGKIVTEILQVSIQSGIVLAFVYFSITLFR
jgi:hypothetical protein